MKINLDELNDDQREAVIAKEGSYQITSVAGSGKTRVLTARTAYLIGQHEVDPDTILLATFSKTAENEIKERMAKIINKRILDYINIGTFHSLGYKILRLEYKRLRNPMAIAFDSSQRQILSGKPQQWMIEAIMKEAGIDLNDKNQLSVHDVMHTISLAKNGLLDVAKFSIECVDEKDFQIANIYKLYEEKKKEEKLIDFNDMILLLYKLFKEHPDVLKKYQKKFDYIMVDESQDNNFAQYEILQMLGQPHNNVFIVGDDDQSMYGFQGARPEEFINFKERYPDLKMINLSLNYRSLPSILNVANKLIAHNTIRIPKKLIPFKAPTENNDEVKFDVFANEDEEAENVTKKIEAIKSKGAKYKDCSVLIRTNAQTRALEDHFIRNMIPYVIYGGTSFYERKEVKDMIAYMKLSINPHDDEAFERVVNTPSRYLGRAFIDNLKTNARRRKCSLYDSLKTANLTPSQHKNGMNYYSIINKLNKFAIAGATAENLVKEIRKETKYDDFMRKEAKEEDNDILENLNSLEAATSKHNSPKSFLSFIDLLIKNKVKNADAVQVMTVHKSKGLEFPYVFLIGFSENLLPHKYAVESGDPLAIEEERRLAYVALTRAELELHVSSISSYNNKPTSESRFAFDCEFIKKEGKKEE